MKSRGGILKKTIKLLASLMLVMLLAFQLVGCGTKDDRYSEEEVKAMVDEAVKSAVDTIEKDTPVTTTPVETTGTTDNTETSDNTGETSDTEAPVMVEESVYSKTELPVFELLESISNQDIEAFRIITETTLADAPLLTDKDIQKFFMTGEFENLLGNGFEIKSIAGDLSTTGDVRSFTSEYTVNGKDYGFASTVYMNEDLKWKVKINGLYIEEWALKAYPSYTVVTVDGVDVTGNRDGNYLIIPKVAQTVKTLYAKSVGGSYEGEIMPISGRAEDFAFQIVADEEYANEAIEWFKISLNNFLDVSHNSGDVIEILPLFDENTYSIDGVNALLEMSRNTHLPVDATIISCEPYTDKDTGYVYEAKIKGEEPGTIVMALRLKYAWQEYRYSYGGEMTIRTVVTLLRVDDGFVIKSITEEENVFDRLNLNFEQ